MTASLSLDLAGARVRFTCGFGPLMQYARAHFDPALAESGEESQTASVQSELRWHEGHPPADVAAAYPEVRGAERVDRDLYCRDGRVVWLRIDDLRDLHLRFHWNGATLTVRGDYYHRLSKDARADRLRRLVYRRQMDGLRRKRFTRLLYFLVYYPVFWFLEHERRAHPLHAGAVDTPRGGLLLAGPSGVGKSTLTAALGTADGGHLLSDTFVVHRGTTLWAVPEPLLLDRWSMEWLGEAGRVLTEVPHNYALGRGGYSIPRSRYQQRSEAVAVVLPRRTPEPYLRRIDGAQALSRIDAFDDIVNDLRRYRPLAAVLELVAPSGLAQSRLRGLEQLTALPCYELGLTASLTRDEAVQRLLAILEHSEQLRSTPSGALH